MPLHVVAEAALVLEAPAEAASGRRTRPGAARCRRRYRCRRRRPASPPGWRRRCPASRRTPRGLPRTARRCLQRAPGDLGRAQAPVGDAGAVGERAVDQLDARTRQQPLERHMRMLPPGVLQDLHFALVAGREAGVAAFGSQRDPALRRRESARRRRGRCPRRSVRARCGPRGAPPPTCRRWCGNRLGRDIASAVKSLTTTRLSKRRRSRISSIENCQW